MLIYLLKSGACLAIFMAFYRFFLEKENMHVFKRYYLMGALIIAFGIPLVTFTHYVEVTPFTIVNSPVASFDYYTEAIPTIQETNYLSIILWSIYGVGALLFGAKFVMNLLQIVLRIHHNPKQKSKHIVHVLLSDLIMPHTFFKYIFLNKQKFERQEIPQAVFWHEETHAKQKHSIDVLFIELLQVIFWFNPLIYFAKHSIKMNHEFLADQAVLNRGISASYYQHILLAFSSDAAESPLANAINYSSTRHAIGVIKKRFTVMKTHTSKRNIWLRSALLLPVFALALYGFSEKKEVIKPLSNQVSSSESIQNMVYNNESNVLSLPEKVISEKTKQESFYTVLLNANGQYLINGKLGTLKTIENDFKGIAADKSKSKTIVFKYDRDAPQATIDQVTDLVKKYHLKIVPWTPEASSSNMKTQIKATPEEIEEYNKLAKHYNSQYPNKMVIKMKDMRRLSELYDKMINDQRASVEPMPNFPPPPPPTQTDGTRSAAFVNKTTPPPPPPMPPNPSEKQNRGYEKAMNDYKVQRESYTYKYTNANGEVVDVIIIPENDGMVTPPSPPSLKKQGEEDPLREKVVIGFELKNSSKTQEQTQYTTKNPNEPITVVGNEIKEKSKNDNNRVPPPPPVSPMEHIKIMSKKGAIFYYNNKSISVDEAIKYIKDNKQLSISTTQLDTDQPKVYISTELIKIEKKNNSELVMVNGKKPINQSITMSRAELMDATLSIKDGTIISFYLKIPGKQTQSITGNTMNAETKALIKEAFEKDPIQIYMIKNSNNEAHPPIKILIKE